MSEEDVLEKLKRYYSKLYWLIVLNTVIVCLSLLLMVVSIETFRLTLIKVSADVFKTYESIDESYSEDHHRIDAALRRAIELKKAEKREREEIMKLFGRDDGFYDDCR